MAAVLDKRKVGATGNILASRDTSSPAPATQSDVMDKAELYKDQKIAKDGYLGTRNTKTSQPAVATDHTDKADLYADMKTSVDKPASTNNSNQKDSSTPRTPRYPAIYEPLPKEPKPTAPQQTVPQEIPQVNTTLGGLTPEEVQKWLDEYQYYNLSGTRWKNSYGVDGNVRTEANMIRQQMEKNTDDWHKTDDKAVKDYLHQNNLALEQLLQQYNGGAKSYYDPVTGKWNTNNGNAGYGDVNLGEYAEWARYGVDEDYYNYLRTTPDRYHNMVDYDIISNPVQNEDGFSGRYSPYKYGGIQNYIGPSNVSRLGFYHYDAIGDDFMDEYSMRPVTDANGNIVFVDDFVKDDVHASAYTQQFLPEIVDGIIQTNDFIKSRPGGGRGTVNTDPNASATGGGSGGGGGSYGRYGSGNGGYSDMLEQMYGEALAAQLAQLESSYKQNVSDLDASSVKADANYNEQKRQTDGTSAQNAANWREMANAYGLNSGTIGQAALAQNNQRQSDLNTLGVAQAQAQAEIERQRTLLGQQYQLQINQAIAENNQQKAQALYQEAVRMDEVLRQEQQNNANLMLQYAQMAMQQQQYNSDLALQYAKMAGSPGGGPSSEQVIMPDYDNLYLNAGLSGNPDNFLNSDKLVKQFGAYDTAGLLDGYQRWFDQNVGPAINFVGSQITPTGARDGDYLATLLRNAGYPAEIASLALNAMDIR